MKEELRDMEGLESPTLQCYRLRKKKREWYKNNV